SAERLRRPERLPRAGERVPRSRSDARVPGPCAGTGEPCAGAVLQRSSPFFLASVRPVFRRWFRPLRVTGRRSQPRRRLGGRPLRRIRGRWAPPLTAVDALSPPRYQRFARAFNSAEECHLHTVEAVGSIPTTPTISAQDYWAF